MKNYIGAQRVDDPKAYVGNVATVLMHYPESVAKRVADPHSGIAGEVKWYPNLAELKAFCEKRMEPFREEAERRRRHEDTRLLLTPPTASTEERERAWERWKQDIRPAIEGKPSEAETRAAALKRLDELDHQYRQVRRERGLPPLTDDMRRILEPGAQENGSA